jgi:uncharacterized membrane protein
MEYFKQKRFRIYTGILCALFLYLLASVGYEHGMLGISLVIFGFIFGAVFVLWVMVLAFRKIEEQIK